MEARRGRTPSGTAASTEARPSASSRTKRIAPATTFLSRPISAIQRSKPSAGAPAGSPARAMSVARRSTSAESIRPRRRDTSAATTMPAATASPCSHCPYPIAFSIAWPNVWPKLSSARSPCSRSSAPTISALIRQLSWIACASASRLARHQRVHLRLEPRQERAVADRAVLDHFREARGELARRQRAQAIGVDQHGARLVERADHVLAERMVDAGLAAHRRVDLREQRRRHLHERHAALVDRRGESRDVADDAAAQRDQRGRALGAQFEQPCHHRLQRLPVLVGFAVRDLHRQRRDAGGRQAFGQRREPVAGDGRVGHDDRLRDAALREQRTGVGG